MPEELIPVGAGSRALAVADASVGGEVKNAGMAFGDLVKTTGKAVAETQLKLNQTGAATATALATTLVDVIAVQEKIYDDSGTIDSVKTYTQELPLVAFIDPVFYEWTEVRLQGLFMASEFATASSSSSLGVGVQAGGVATMFGGFGSVNAQVTTTNSKSDATNDTSYGMLRMNAMLQPKQDTTVPKPIQAIQGPRLSIIQGAITDVKTDGKLTARTMSVLIEYRRRDGNAISNKAISIESDGVAWSIINDRSTETGNVSDKNKTTDPAGSIEILLRREFLDEDADTTSKDFVVTARIGIVQNNTSVTF